MTDVVIEVSVPQSTDITAVADSADITADPSGAAVIVVSAPGPPGPPGDPLTPEGLAEVTDDVTTALTPPISLVLLFENGLA